MDRYEELGLKKSASTAEIRKAYRKLALLLHPDRQGDPELRRLAELQMQRLNETVGPLMDGTGSAPAAPEAGSALPRVPPIVVVRPPEAVGPWRHPFWWFLAGAGLASLCWYAAGDRITVTARPPAAAAEADSVDNGELAQRIRELEDQVAELRKTDRPAPPRAGGTAGHGLAGAWFYQSKPLATDTSELPRNVSLQIMDGGGVVRGEYSSTAGTPSSTVAFHFEGSGGGRYVKLPWAGPGGAKGEIELRLLRPNVLEASWWAYGTSTNSTETASTAILRRLTSR